VVEVGADDLAGQVDRARPLAEEGRAVLLPLAEARGVALAISVLARCDQQEGDLAGVVAARGRPGEAARLAGAAEAWRAVSRLPREPVRSEDLGTVLDRLREEHPAEWQSGAAMPAPRVLDEAAAAAAEPARDA
jgi:hypothetical protein